MEGSDHAPAPDDDRVASALTAPLPWGPPADSFRLFSGSLAFPPLGGTALPAAPGRIDLLFRSGTRMHWRVDFDGLDSAHRAVWERSSRATTSGQLIFDFAGLEATLPAHVLSRGRGMVPGEASSSPDRMIRRIVTQWVNLPDVGSDILIALHDGGSHEPWLGRRVVEAPPWRITFDKRADHDAAYRSAKEDYLSVATHVVMIEWASGELFSPAAASSVVGNLQVGLSFALGRWAAPVLALGMDDEGSVVQSWWATRLADTPGHDAYRWWPENRSEFLDDYLARWVTANEDDTEHGHLLFLVTSALAAGQKPVVEQRLATAIAALEYLSWIDEILKYRMDETKWRNKGAPWRLRRMLTKARIPLAVDATRVPVLAEWAARDGLDGPAAIVDVRDQITHPKHRGSLYGAGSPIADAARLASRYLDLILLHRLGYRGWTRDRTKQTGWEGEVDRVPWVKEGQREE